MNIATHTAIIGVIAKKTRVSFHEMRKSKTKLPKNWTTFLNKIDIVSLQAV
jgi:hypothetical protein